MSLADGEYGCLSSEAPVIEVPITYVRGGFQYHIQFLERPKSTRFTFLVRRRVCSGKKSGWLRKEERDLQPWETRGMFTWCRILGSIEMDSAYSILREAEPDFYREVSEQMRRWFGSNPWHMISVLENKTGKNS